MTDIPKRTTLVGQVVGILRRDLERGEWSKHLPTEAFLCDRLQVSRKTLRGALEILGREGLVDSSQGRRRRITPRAHGVRRPVRSNVVAWLSPDPLHTLSPFMLLYVSELRRHLQEAGYALQIVSSPVSSEHPQTALESLTHQTHAACWILVHSTAPVQRWFWQRRIPCLLSGAAHKDIDLPSIATNHRAVCRHAVGVFVRHGHRRIALFAPRSNLAGNLASEQGFREGCQSGSRTIDRPLVVHHDSTVEGIRRALDTVLQSPTRPSGLLVSYPQHVLTVMSHASHAGMQIPNDVSIISRDYDFFLDHLHPSVAHYEFDHRMYAARLARLVTQLAATGFSPPRTTWMTPGFKTGGTLASLPR